MDAVLKRLKKKIVKSRAAAAAKKTERFQTCAYKMLPN